MDGVDGKRTCCVGGAKITEDFQLQKNKKKKWVPCLQVAEKAVKLNILSVSRFASWNGNKCVVDAQYCFGGITGNCTDSIQYIRFNPVQAPFYP